MTPAEIMDKAIAEHKPSKVFGLLSGGHDSLTVTHWAAGHLGSRMDAVVHIDTGIGLPETQEFVRSVCEQNRWPLRIYRARDCGQVYEDLVTEHGFPGADHHTKMFNRLKERPLRALLRDNPDGRVMLISGLRRQESGRRMRLRNEPVQREGRRVWAAPFFNWSNDEVRAYHKTHALPTNPAKTYLCMSGECLCGAYARPGELKEIETFFPVTGKRLRDLEAKVRAAGFPWGWDEQPPAWWGKRQAAKKSGQSDAFDAEAESEIQMLCTSCQFRHEGTAESRTVGTDGG
jgi:3'-phosphoadenosine 5'-phosphosulfate sulfotransferase (PAPS reductase)/FAD synthetase